MPPGPAIDDEPWPSGSLFRRMIEDNVPPHLSYKLHSKNVKEMDALMISGRIRIAGSRVRASKLRRTEEIIEVDKKW